ncbi:MAG: phospho-sugar mutase [Dermatophilaceae bacterium]
MPDDGARLRDRVTSVVAAARVWAADDPDPVTSAEIESLCVAASSGDMAAADELADAMSGMLEFGTAGLRGPLGGGPNRMNRAVVIRAAAGLTRYLRTLSAEPFVVVGFDARTNSDVFARDTCAVVTGLGGRAAVLPRPLPTPVLAYAIRYLGADAGVMVTASHNPPEDNGYKVYVGDGSQIVPPVDEAIAAEIAAVESVASVRRADDGWQTLGEDVLAAYLHDAASVVDPDSPRDLTVVHTALHGVGSETVRRAFTTAGFPAPQPVPSQADPDPAFPTVSFPNPEEPGAMDAALELAEQTGPDLVLATDPDADRCAVAVPAPGGWRMMRGDEVGVLLGSHVLARMTDAERADSVFACSIVSSRWLAAICRASGVRHEETLTGFKWIGRVPGLRYGYEEALGYCVDPVHVPDKDGVTAALLVAELAATLKAQGRTLADRLDDLAEAHGVHATDALSVRVDDLGLIGRVMARLRAEPPTTIGGVDIAHTDDLARGDGGLPPTEGLRWYLADDSRVVVRPSGTEPKLKVYLECVEPVADDGLSAARERANRRLTAIRADLETRTRA